MLQVTSVGDRVRLDKWLAAQLGFTRSAVVSLIAGNNIVINGCVAASKSAILKVGDEIEVNIPLPKCLPLEAQNLPLDVVFEDSDVIVVNKARGMVVHPAAGNEERTLVNALLYHCDGNLSGINGVARPGIVHRLDKDTSGLLVVAKNDNAHSRLAAQIKEHGFLRRYHAVIHGRLKADRGVVSLPIGRSVRDRKRMCVTFKNSKMAITEFLVLAEYERFSYVQLTLRTGRTHQIRVHMSHLGCPLAGDPVYGSSKDVVARLQGQCLHAMCLGFVHPSTNEYMEFTAPLPNYFTGFLATLRY
jgi:23S rRNA pseudouridine1911/1915/1917 synthase